MIALLRFALAAALASGIAASVAAGPPVDDAFFETRVRPLLAARCVSCHAGAAAAGGLRLDSPAGLKRGGGRGALWGSDPARSLLLQAVRHEGAAPRMPPTGKLPAEQIADLEAWVQGGAPLPQTVRTAAAAGFDLAGRRRHWAYQPLKAPPLPAAPATVDAFLQTKRVARGVRLGPPADRRVWLRRLTFDLTGLPPTPKEMQAFLNDRAPGACERQVDRLLASAAYGERWGRHWLDLVRYGESMGHEGDYEIPNAYQYRDYVIRAFNADLPYDRLVREHLAGDLLPDPRRDAVTGRNESILGTGFFWLGEGKHSPVDVRQEQADRTDNQIDVLGKAFLGQTIACARCHDHKFDPIPTTDYYALYGILTSSRYQQAQAIAPEKSVRALKAWRAGLDRRPLAGAWRRGIESLTDTRLLAAVVAEAPAPEREGIALAPFDRWRATGEAFVPSRPGDLVLTADPAHPVAGLLSRPAAHSALLSRRLEGALRSPTFTLDRDFLHLRLSGRAARVHLIVDNFQVIRDPIYGPLAFDVPGDAPAWRSIDLRLWKGHRAYIELSDSPLPNLSVNPAQPLETPGEGWIRLDEAYLSDRPQPPARGSALAGRPAGAVRAALAAALARWERSASTEADAEALALLDRLLADGVLESAPLAGAAQQLATIERDIVSPVRAPAMCEGTGLDERVFVRGNHRTLGAAVPRLQLALLAGDPRSVEGSGRLVLAQRILAHPLAARVIVNRIWKHHFGVGLVPTPDDFGRMGEKPTHPELLDWLAATFAKPAAQGGLGFSLKKLHRLLLLTDTYRAASALTDPGAERKDPKNALLHRMPVRRLEAEAIRDALLAVSGRLNPTMYGPSVPVHLTEFVEGRGRPESGPLDGDGRRSVYLAIRRNFLSPFALAFDFPIPFTCIGRRTLSNVPAQALAMMNGPFVRQQAGLWAERLLRERPGEPAASRVAGLYETAFGRPPSAAETRAAVTFLNAERASGTEERAALAALCHVLVNLKEFVFVR